MFTRIENNKMHSSTTWTFHAEHLDMMRHAGKCDDNTQGWIFHDAVSTMQNKIQHDFVFESVCREYGSCTRCTLICPAGQESRADESFSPTGG